MVLDWKDIAKFKSEEELENFLLSKSIKISKKKITTINCKYCPSSNDTNDDSLIFCRAISCMPMQLWLQNALSNKNL